jgi:hypothetical protein
VRQFRAATDADAAYADGRCRSRASILASRMSLRRAGFYAGLFAAIFESVSSCENPRFLDFTFTLLHSDTLASVLAAQDKTTGYHQLSAPIAKVPRSLELCVALSYFPRFADACSHFRLIIDLSTARGNLFTLRHISDFLSVSICSHSRTGVCFFR